MQVIKPQALGLSTRPIEFKKRFGLCISAYLHLPFQQAAGGTLWAEQSMWAFLTKEMAAPLIDEGVAKLTPEFLVHGKAFPPQRPAPACAVRASFAGAEKTVLVFGDRYWHGGQASSPQPFDSMDLRWPLAYGGPDFPSNPSGRGRQPTDGVTWLPNTELPHDRLQRPEQAVAPAGFGALDLMHPARSRYRGTYDADYLKLHAPGFAPDTDWRHFNLAPADQWMTAPLRGDEAFAFENMHPDKPLLDGRLPGFRARVFAGYRMPEGEPKVREVPLRLTTVWFFPHAERCIAIFQGLAEVGTDDGSDIASLLGAVERLEEVKPDQHYVDAAAKRVDAQLGPIYSIIDSDLLPTGVSTLDPDVVAAKEPFEMAGLQADAQYRRAQIDVEFARDAAVRMGKNPDKLKIQMPPREKVPEGEALAPYLEQKMKESQAQQWTAVEDAVTTLERTIVMCEEQKVDISRLQHRGPPLYNAETHLAEIRRQASVGTHPPDFSKLLPKLCQMEESLVKGYLQSAHRQPPAYPMAQDEAASLRAEMIEAIPAGIKFFAGMNFTGADFSGLDLREVNFQGAWLESVNFSGANLSGANFSQAVLAHANLEGATALGTLFCKANLGKALLSRCVFDNADFSEATLTGCAFAGTQMRRAKFAKADFLETTWGEADWSGAELAGQLFHKVDLQGMLLTEADLSACNFLECDLTKVDLRGATLAGATFVTCKLDHAKLSGAQCMGAITVKDCTLIQVDMNQANLQNFNFGASNLRGARMVRATLDGANLTGARMEGADLRLATAKGALIRKTVLLSANLAGVNFTDAILSHADLRGADLRRSNLFGADLSRVRLDDATSFDGALVTRARTWPRVAAEKKAGA